MALEIKALNREEYEGYSFDVKYCTDKYYDVALIEGGFQLIKHKTYKPIQKGFTDTLFSAWLEEPLVYGAFENDELVGFVEGSKETWHNLFRVSNLFVFENYRKQGIGERLLSYLIEKVKEQGTYRGIILETQSCNYAAISLYRKLGFHLCRIDTHEYSNNDVANHEIRLDLIIELEGTNND